MQMLINRRIYLAALLLAGCNNSSVGIYEDEAAPLNLSIVPNPEERLANAESAAAAMPDSAQADVCTDDSCADDSELAEPAPEQPPKGKNDKDKAKSKAPKAEPQPVVSDYPQISALCPRGDSERIMMHVKEPTLVANYDLETLGIIFIQVTPATYETCVRAAIADGAEILDRTENHLELFYPTRLEYFFDEAQIRINRDALEGRWSDVQKRIIPGVSGRRLDIDASRQAFFSALSNGLDAFELVVVPEPAISTDISSVADFRPSVLIGEYKTQFSNKKNRTINVKLAASFMDGLFLMPGASFSYNAWVGERSEARGFKEAPVIENGEMVEGLGGGACQVSSTIHAAALVSGLEILERYNHSLPSHYIGKGLDAVVSYPMLDLRVRNNLERPVVLRLQIQENTLIARFYSDQPKPFKVEFKTEIHEEIPFKEIITEDPTLEEGTFKITRYGKPGYKILRTRIFDRDGKKQTERLLMDTYQSQPQLVSIAPGVIYPPPPE